MTTHIYEHDLPIPNIDLMIPHDCPFCPLLCPFPFLAPAGLIMAESGKGGMLRQVMQKVSKVFNRGLMRKDSSKKAEDLDVDNDFDPENDELPLSTRENILGRRDSRFIMAETRLGQALPHSLLLPHPVV